MIPNMDPMNKIGQSPNSYISRISAKLPQLQNFEQNYEMDDQGRTWSYQKKEMNTVEDKNIEDYFLAKNAKALRTLLI